MKRAGIPTIELSAKEGLALNNGTQALTAAGALALYDVLKLVKVADIADALFDLDAGFRTGDLCFHRAHFKPVSLRNRGKVWYTILYVFCVLFRLSKCVSMRQFTILI